MALVVINSDTIGGTAYLFEEDDLYIKAGVMLVAPENELAIFASGTQQTVHIDGTVLSTTSTLQWDHPDDAGVVTGNRLETGVDSLIKTFGQSTAGVYLTGGDWEVVLRGIISSNHTGLQFVDATLEDTRMTNSGEVVATLIGLVLDVAGSLSLENSGTISGINSLQAQGEGIIAFENTGRMVGNINATGLGTLEVENGGVIKGRLLLGAGDDIYDGADGKLKDSAYGGAGADTLIGGREKNIFEGAVGADLIAGGLGADQFVYASMSDSGRSASSRDRITDFSQRDGDRLDLSALELDFVGKSKFSGADEVRYQTSGGNTLVHINLDRDKTAEMTIELEGKVKLVESDFIL